MKIFVGFVMAEKKFTFCINFLRKNKEKNQLSYKIKYRRKILQFIQILKNSKEEI